MGYFQNVYLDINPEKSYTVINAKQFDSGTRGIIAHITNNGEPYTITGDNVVFRVKRPDGHIITNDAIINQNGTVTALFLPECLTVYGRAYADIAEIIEIDENNKKILSTVTFILNIKPSPNIE